MRSQDGLSRPAAGTGPQMNVKDVEQGARYVA
jgi:hypothetical protein